MSCLLESLEQVSAVCDSLCKPGQAVQSIAQSILSNGCHACLDFAGQALERDSEPLTGSYHEETSFQIYGGVDKCCLYLCDELLDTYVCTNQIDTHLMFNIPVISGHSSAGFNIINTHTVVSQL